MAITRVTKAAQLWSHSFDKCFVKTDPRVEYEIESMNIERPYKMKNFTLMNKSMKQVKN